MRANNLGRNWVFLRSGYSEPSAEHGLIINGRQRRSRCILTRSLRAVGWLIRRKGVQWGRNNWTERMRRNFVWTCVLVCLACLGIAGVIYNVDRDPCAQELRALRTAQAPPAKPRPIWSAMAEVLACRAG
jgi:hypothetical protein